MQMSKRPLAYAAVLAAMLATASSGARAGDIVDTATQAGGFTQLLHAARIAGLEQTLRGKGPLTVFAPTDEAFGKLPKGTLFKLLAPENKALLAAVVKAHVVAGAYPAERLEKAKAVEYTIPAVGTPLTIKKGGGITADGAKVVKTDIKADNGIIHVVEQVVIPPKVAAALARSGRAN